MSAEILPARGEPGAPPAVAAPRLLAVFGMACAAAVLFWLPLLAGGGLQGHDWQTHHLHYFDWTHQAFTLYRSFPLFMADAWVTPNFVANAESPSLGPLAWLLLWLPADAYVKLLVVVFCAAGLTGGYLLARDLDVAAPVAAGVSAAYAFGGFFVAHVAVGHHWSMGAWLLPALVWLARRAVLGSSLALVAGALLNAFTILGGQHQPFIWNNLVLGMLAVLWCLRVRTLQPLLRLSALVALAGAFAAVKLVPLWLEFGDYAPAARLDGLPLLSLGTALLARGRGLDTVDPAIDYAFGAGWWEFAFYLGPLALLACAAGLMASRGVWPLLAIGGFFLLIALDPGPWPLLQDLPVWRSQRTPSRFLLVALFALLFASATGLERLRRLAAARRPRATVAVAWLLALAVAGDLWWESRGWQSAATGEGVASRTHRPRPEVLQEQGALAELVGFAPNRLVYAVEAQDAARVVLPLRYGSGPGEWEVKGAELERDGPWVSLRVGPGRSRVSLRYRTPGLAIGLGVSAIAVLGCGFATVVPRLRGSTN